MSHYLLMTLANSSAQVLSMQYNIVAANGYGTIRLWNKYNSNNEFGEEFALPRLISGIWIIK